jgi:hypothetical protein
MNTKSIKSFAALLLLGTGLSASMNPAKADLFCYPWEVQCSADGRVGTSENDLLGLPGGDTAKKVIIGGAAAAGAVMGGTVGGAVGVGVGNAVADGYYNAIPQETRIRMKNEAFDAFKVPELRNPKYGL